MRRFLTILFLLFCLLGESQVIINPYILGGGGSPSCPFAVTLTSSSNLTESPAGQYNLTNNALDGNSKITVSLPASTDGHLEYEYQSTTPNSAGFAICADPSNSISASYYGSAKYVVFVYSGTYWYNYNQADLTDSGIAANDGDIVRIVRIGTDNMLAQYYRGGSWTNIVDYTGTETAQIFWFISCLQEGVNKGMKNVKHCGGT